MAMKGRRLKNARVGNYPLPYDELKPGDYWKVMDRNTGRALNVRDNHGDRHWWGKEDDNRFDQNLTGGVWGVIDPTGRYGLLSIHTVREEKDGTISVRPGDGSSNSILISGGSSTKPPWHGYIEHGVWRET